jgi:capsular exopolysaccharide synthesis family protein
LPQGNDVLVVVNQSIDLHLVMYHDPRSPVAEQYRTFRTNLLAINPDGAPRALSVTSSLKGEGKSITAANLALSLVELPDTRVLLLDADLRDPRIADLMGTSIEPGLSDLLLDGLPLDRVIYPTLVPNLSVLPAGREVRNPSELLGSTRVADLVSALKAEYNYLLFDTPPVLPFADAPVLGARLDGSLLVVRLDKTPREQAERSLATMRAAGNNVIGCFLAGSRALDEASKQYVIPED